MGGSAKLLLLSCGIIGIGFGMFMGGFIKGDTTFVLGGIAAMMLSLIPFAASAILGDHKTA